MGVPFIWSNLGVKNVSVQTDKTVIQTMENGQLEKLTWAFSSGELINTSITTFDSYRKF
jgi:hypothetical protein